MEEKLRSARQAFDEARFTEAARRCRELMNEPDITPPLVAAALALEGGALVQLGQYRRGLKSLHESVNVHEALGEEMSTGFAHNYIGAASEELKDLAGAYAHYERALYLADQAADRSLQARVLANLGDALVTDGKPEQALVHLKRAAGCAQAVEEWSLLGWVEGATARALMSTGDLEQAGLYFENAITHSHAGSGARAEGEILLHFGNYLKAMNLKEQALENYRSALRIFARVNARWGIRRAHRALSDFYADNGQYQKALEHYRLFHEAHADMLEELTDAWESQS
ncbi:MAG: tetratricopeptide repeat protein [Pseudomonadota bacterium]